MFCDIILFEKCVFIKDRKMSRKYSSHFKQTIVPCVALSALTGVFTGILIFAFRFCAEKVIGFSDTIFSAVRSHPAFLPLLILGAASLGSLSYLLIKLFPDARGGDSQTTITFLRGFIPLKWIQNTVVIFISSLITYFAGVPLGEEGTSTHMGAAVGKGTVRIFAKKKDRGAWDRYIMTGGACGGFASATSAPLTAILFAFDEAHRRFSPIIFLTATTATLSSWATTNLLCKLTNRSIHLFAFEEGFAFEIMPFKDLWTVVLVGAVCGLLAIIYARFYRVTEKILNVGLKKVPLIAKFIAVFVLVAVFGFFTPDLIGSGHNIIHHLMEGHAPVWYYILLYLVIRSVMLLVSGALEIVGGMSVPAMAAGALIGALMSKPIVALGLMDEKYAPILVIVGVASFLGATNRAPLNAITFACEALFGFTNLIPIAIGVAVSFIVIEPIGVTAFSDLVIEEKAHDFLHGKELHTVDAHFTVQSDSFIAGKEVRDILWPSNCAVLSVDKINTETPIILAGDVLHMRYKTHDPDGAYATLESIIGRQNVDPGVHDVHQGDENYIIPEQ